MKYFSIGMLLLSGFLSFMFLGNNNDLFKETYLNAKSKSQIENKPLLLLFVGDKCRVCEDQKDMISGDDELIKFIENKFESATINIDDFDGRAIRDYYQVSTIPSMVLVTQSGEVKWSHMGNISKSSLMASLNGQPMNGISQPLASEPKITMENTQMAINTRPEVKTPKTQNYKETPIVTTTPRNVISYQIQYGFFGSDGNANNMVDKLSKAGQSECYLQNEVRDGKTYFRVLSPMYSQMDIANTILSKMKSKGIDGQIKTVE